MYELIFLAIVVIAVFAWLVKLSYDLRKATQIGFQDIEYKIAGIEEAAVEIKKELDKLERSLNDKIDRRALEDKLDELVKTMKKKYGR